MKRKWNDTEQESTDVQPTVVAMSSLPASSSDAASPSSLLHSAAHSSETSGSAAPGWRPTGWSDLPTDWIGYISEFLSLRDFLSSFLPVCRRWRDCLPAVPPRDEGITLDDKEQLAKLGDASIDVRRHVVTLTADVLPLESLAVTHRLPRLTCLSCYIDCGDDEEKAKVAQQRWLKFPSQLTTLNLELGMAMDYPRIPRWSQLEHAFEAVAQVPTLTRLNATLEVHERSHPTLIPLRTIQPLGRLSKSLTHLTITNRDDDSADDEAPFSRAHIDFFNSLHRLESLQLDGIGSWTEQALEWATESMMRSFKSIPFKYFCVFDSLAPVIGRLTGLEEFHPALITLRDPSFLANLTKLTSTSLECKRPVDPALLVAALSHCTRLEELEIDHDGLTSEHLCSFLPSLPRLWFLGISSTQLSSLIFASSVGHLASTLKVLELHSCISLAPSEIRHLHALTALSELELYRSFNARLDDDTIASMTPESPRFDRAMWPHLGIFSHTWSTDPDPD